MESLREIADNYVKGEENLRNTVGALEKNALQSTDAERRESVNVVIEHYFEHYGKHMEQSLLERLTDVILAEDIQSQYKTEREYPFQSERRIRRNFEREVSPNAAATRAMDGQDYSLPIRKRKRG